MGNTRVLPLIVLVSPVHPHTHGEHSRAAARKSICAGSSPHAWGTLSSWSPHLVRLRFIPTRMGNTSWSSSQSSDFSVHPHTHGEHAEQLDKSTIPVGSSPHAWGTLFTLLPREGNFLLPVSGKMAHAECTPLSAIRNVQRLEVWSRILHDHSHIRVEKR